MKLTDEQVAQLREMEKVLFAYAAGRRDRMIQEGVRLVHYTSAENAIKIIKSKTFWLRDTRSMSDFREVEHGYEMLHKYFADTARLAAFNEAVDVHFDGAGRDVLKRFNDWWFHIRTTTYICCFSEHSDHENAYGRLSMWRAYAPKTGVAMVFNMPTPYSALGLHAYLSPVAYLEQEAFWQLLDDAFGRIKAASDVFRAMSRENFVFAIYRMLVMATLSLKHPAFLEEREWRLIYLPFETPSTHVVAETVAIGGVPQLVYKVALENHPDDGITEISLPEILERVIIGPTQYVGPVHAALVKELTDKGVAQAHEKIFFSAIPLRT